MPRRPPRPSGARALGVVGIGFRVQPLVNSVLPPHLARELRLRIVDEQALAGPVQGVLFDSAPDRQAPAGAPFWRARIAVADRQWTVMAHPQGGAWAGQESTGILVLFGAGLSLALAALTRTLAQANLKTEAQLSDAAHELTRERDQLRLSEARFRMLFEHSFDAVLRTRPDGRVLEANASACALFGGTVETLQSLSRERLVDPTDPRVTTLLQERHRSGRVSGALRMRRVDGSLFEAEVSSNIYIDGDGQLATSMIVRDVTERQRLADRLQERQRLEAIGTLAGGVAHDFNNMLAAILGNVGLAQQDIPRDSPAQARLRLVHQAGNRARQLVRQILTFSRQAPHEQAVQPLQPLVDEAMALLRSTLPPTVRLQVQPSPVPLWARVDGAQIQQLLLNLCTNAWQALPDETGDVRVALERCSLTEPDARLLGLAAGDHACLHVDDDGHGMDAAVRARIFEPFFTTKPPGRGTGLGLAVVHGVVTEHAGAIRVDSEPGRGTRFSVFLPLAGAPPAAAADAQSPGTARPAATDSVVLAGQRRARILYVDDDEVVSLTAMALLQRAGHEVRVAASGEAALAALSAPGDQVDLVVTDFNMPGLSGLGVAEWVRQTSPGTRVILVSGLVTDELRQRARQLGIPEVLPKEELLERLLHAAQQALVTAG